MSMKRCSKFPVNKTVFLVGVGAPIDEVHGTAIGKGATGPIDQAIVAVEETGVHILAHCRPWILIGLHRAGRTQREQAGGDRQQAFNRHELRESRYLS
jgi:hypothetical protein